MTAKFTAVSMLCLAACQWVLFAAATPAASSRDISVDATSGLTPLVDRLARSQVGLTSPLRERVPAEEEPLQVEVAWEPAPLPAHDLKALVHAVAARHGLDPHLVELVVWHESGFNPVAISRTGAMGLMQLMPGTAAGLGVTDPFDPVQNVSGGVRYLAAQLNRFGDVALALAAYNAGPGAVERYGGVPPYAETMNYVDSILGEYFSRQPASEEGQSESLIVY